MVQQGRLEYGNEYIFLLGDSFVYTVVLSMDKDPSTSTRAFIVGIQDLVFMLLPFDCHKGVKKIEVFRDGLYYGPRDLGFGGFTKWEQHN